jgi:hypothetical protein
MGVSIQGGKGEKLETFLTGFLGTTNLLLLLLLLLPDSEL